MSGVQNSHFRPSEVSSSTSSSVGIGERISRFFTRVSVAAPKLHALRTPAQSPGKVPPDLGTRKHIAVVQPPQDGKSHPSVRSGEDDFTSFDAFRFENAPIESSAAPVILHSAVQSPKQAAGHSSSAALDDKSHSRSSSDESVDLACALDAAERANSAEALAKLPVDEQPWAAAFKAVSTSFVQKRASYHAGNVLRDTQEGREATAYITKESRQEIRTIGRNVAEAFNRAAKRLPALPKPDPKTGARVRVEPEALFLRDTVALEALKRVVGSLTKNDFPAHALNLVNALAERVDSEMPGAHRTVMTNFLVLRALAPVFTEAGTELGLALEDADRLGTMLNKAGSGNASPLAALRKDATAGLIIQRNGEEVLTVRGEQIAGVYLKRFGELREAIGQLIDRLRVPQHPSASKVTILE